MADSDAEKILSPTPLRRQQARARGEVAQSRELTSALLLLGMLVALATMGERLWQFLQPLYAEQLGSDAWLSIDGHEIAARWQALAWKLAGAVLPLLGLAAGLAVAIDVAQGGPRFLPDKIAPNWSRLSPLAGWQRIVSLNNTMRLGLGLVKIVVVLAVSIMSLHEKYEQILSLPNLAAPAMAAAVWNLAWGVALRIAIALVALAVVDYGWQRWRYEQDLRMTPQEMREELRNAQTDPQIMARRRQTQRQTSSSASVAPEAATDLVTVDPQGTVVVLRYDRSTMATPELLVKQRGRAGQRLCRLAEQRGVRVVTDPSLPAALYREAMPLRPIPPRLLDRVTALLATSNQNPSPTERG